MLLRRVVIALALFVTALLASGQGAEPTLLKYKYAKGDKRYYKNVQTMKQSQTLNVNGMAIKQENSMNNEAILAHEVAEIGADGIALFKTKATRRKMTADFGLAGKFEFDSQSSERDTSSQLGQSMTPLLERLTGSEYQIAVNPQGKVTEVKGYAELVADLLKDNPFGAQFGGGDNKTAVTNEQEAFVILSDKPVKPGDKWEVPVDVELATLGRVKGKLTFNFEGFDKVRDVPTVRIGVTNDMSIELNLDQGGTKVSGTITTNNSSGTVQFDPAAGRVLLSKSTLTMGGQLTVEAGGMTIPVDNQQEQTNSYELLDKLP
ncbi:MAG: DUF6263 family protein [Planctomycetales bacterium]